MLKEFMSGRPHDKSKPLNEAVMEYIQQVEATALNAKNKRLHNNNEVLDSAIGIISNVNSSEIDSIEINNNNYEDGSRSVVIEIFYPSEKVTEEVETQKYLG